MEYVEGQPIDSFCAERRLSIRQRLELFRAVCSAVQHAHQEPDRRYATVEQLSEDLLRWLEGRPVLARPRTAGYRASKFVRRHRLGVSAAAALLLLILGFAIAMGLLAARLSRERDRARQEQRRAEHVERFLTEIFAVSDPWRSTGQTVTARQILDEGARRLDTELADEPVVRSDLMERVGMIYQRLGLPDRAQPLFAGSLATRRQLFGNEHPKVADALYDLALVEEDRGHFEEAIDLVQRALILRRRWYGPKHEAVAQSRHKLGLLLRQQGGVAAAEEHLRAALSLRRKLSPPSPRDVADSLSGLGAVLWERGRYGEAEAAALEALDIVRRMEPVVPERVAKAERVLAACLPESGT